MDRRKGAAWTCLPCYQCQTGKLFAPSMLPSQNGRLWQLHRQGMAEKGQVHLLPPAMRRMLDAGMQFVPGRQRRLPRWTGSGLRAGTHTPQPAPPSLLQQAPIHLAPSPKTIFRLCGHCTTQNPATPSMLIEPDAPVRRSSADRGLSWWGFRGLAAWGFPQISDLVPGPGMTCTLHFSGQRQRQTGTSARDRPRGGVLTTFSRRHAMPRRRCHDWRESS